MNWILRFKNKATLTTFVLAIVAFVYQIAGIFGFVPPVSQDSVIQIVGLIINLLVGLGVVVDPTTKGIKDSGQAMTYTEPK
jgi:phi LC3 family holin